MKDILYCGDTAIDSQASYLAGAMTNAGLKFDYLPSSSAFKTSGKRPDLLILSDYTSKNFSKSQLNEIVQWVGEGMSLWMIGGWDSFYGLNGKYNNELEVVLPVTVSCKDDRVNSFQPIAMIPLAEHEILTGLPWHQCPTVGGLNKVVAKKDANVLLQGRKIILSNDDGNVSVKSSTQYPLLVSGSHFKGKTLAFMSDVAPHWTGGFVDWGSKRVTAKAPKATRVEVGNYYMHFLENCIRWLLK